MTCIDLLTPNETSSKPTARRPEPASTFRTGLSAKQAQSWRPRFATDTTPAPTGTSAPSVATSVVTAVGSIQRMQLHKVYDPRRDNDDKGKATPQNVLVSVIAVHNNDTGLPSPPTTPEDNDDCESTGTAATRARQAVPMRRVAARKPVRRKRVPVIPTAAATAAAAAIAATTAVVEAAEKVPTPPPSPKPEAQKPRQQKTKSYHQWQSMLYLTPAQQAWIGLGSDNGLHKCAKPIVGSCAHKAVKGSLYCQFHSCKGLNQDLDACHGLVLEPEKSRFCATGYHPEVGDAYGNTVSQIQDLGIHNATIAKEKRSEAREWCLEWFNDTFGPSLESPPTPVSPQPSSAASSASSSMLVERQPTYTSFRHSGDDWGSTYVDKWWEGTWSHHVTLPNELRQQASDYARYTSSRAASGAASERSSPLSSRPTSPLLSRSPMLSPLAGTLGNDALLSYKYENLIRTPKWQGRPAKPFRHETI